jgi:hypothetical protein
MNIVSDAYQIYISAIILAMFYYMVIGIIREIFG